MMAGNCAASAKDRRRGFWATQPAACGSDPDPCREGAECGRPGLQLTSSHCGRYHCSCCPAPAEAPECLGALRAPAASIPRSFVTSDWLRGLILNILYTDGKNDNTPCGYVPGTQGGHWSESFRKDGQKIGTLVRTIPPQASIRDSIALIKARMVADLNRLIVMKLVSSVVVNTSYLGGNRMLAEIIITGQSGETTRVGLTGARLQNSWVWS